MQGRIDISVLSTSAWQGALATWRSVALAAIAAALAWLIAHELLGHLSELTNAIRRLAATPQPWPPDVIASDERRVEEVGRGDGSDTGDRGTIVASVLRAAADDLAHVIDQTHTNTEKRAWRSL